MKKTAKGLASLGRGPDTMLVHMSPREVKGLQSLAVATGGSLTVNPKTGLPEAGWLDSILPMVAGAAVTYFSGGTLGPAVSAALSAGAGAATKGATSGDWSAGNLAMGALGGYGGAGLTSGLMSGATPAAAPTAQAAQAATPAATATPAAATVTPVGGGPTLLPSPAAPALQEVGTTAKYMGSPNANQIFEGRVANEGFNPALSRTYDQAGGISGIWDKTNMLQKAGVGMGIMGAMTATDDEGSSYKPTDPEYYVTSFDPDTQRYGASHFTKNPYEAVGAPTPDYYAGSKKGKFAEGGAVPAQNDSFPMANTAVSNYSPKLDPFSGNEISPEQYYRSMLGPQAQMESGLVKPDTAAQQTYMQGLRSLIAPKGPNGPMPTPPPAANQPSAAEPIMSDRDARLQALGRVFNPTKFGTPEDPRQTYTYDPATQSYANRDTTYGQTMKYAGGGGISSGRYAAGGSLLSGAGDGMSDDIPAVIEGPEEQEAALADGEFVIPADVVSGLGNGSTDAGARTLYQMMDRVRQARTGTKKQAPEIDPEEMLPA